MSEFKVEKGIPVPESSRGRKPKYPWSSMNVGDSFLVTTSKLSTLRGLASNVGKATEKKFKVCEVEEGLRVWRTA